ncbi:RNA polymerase sigma factor [Dethiosulfatarculus sandiegensis]|uniref:RNA polymerase sigma factor n=1 Tax=Dethiosulfatarculus sandiegensis TaxID=1429043 RepID=A0A0D2IZ90_9BACT|nr:sigma-70 family RNA polymerase sigma factor [Dethiosulfatarculus sandiegensis]KIX11349.1 RNA polymerase subunit sigma-24 [Dethiosulfatarculus sandiegensis]
MSQPEKERADGSSTFYGEEVSRTARLAREGDIRAFSRLTALYWEKVFGMVYYRTMNAMDAEDITQEVFLKAQTRISGLKDPLKFRPWLFSIALNLVRDFQRKKKLLSILGLEAGAGPDLDTLGGRAFESGLDQAMKREFWEKVKEFTAGLPGAEREVFLLKFLDQLTLEEIAQVVGKKPSTIKTHLYRAVAKFRKNPRLRSISREVL